MCLCLCVIIDMLSVDERIYMDYTYNITCIPVCNSILQRVRRQTRKI